jgi:hypothetical protein
LKNIKIKKKKGYELLYLMAVGFSVFVGMYFDWYTAINLNNLVDHIKYFDFKVEIDKTYLENTVHYHLSQFYVLACIVKAARDPL